MTQPYLVAMQHLEWRARDVLKKHSQNRPLGHLEKQHNYMPAQPVLSCRTVDIDHCGTRTYRSKTNTDIIEEQHRLIHDIYSKARNISTPTTPGRSKSVSNGDSHVLKSLQVEGQAKRPFTSQGTTRITPPQKQSNPPEAALLRRPHTTSGTRTYKSYKTKAATDTHLNLLPDPNIQESCADLHNSHAALRDQWKTENHSLDEGKFVRGKKPESGSNLDPHRRYQWLGFGGGQRENSGGVVDAFTSVSRPEFYAIDGTTGTQVSRQLRKGDKIQIGINGANPPQEWRNKYYMDSRIHYSGNLVPLCWEDELSQPEAKIISPKGPREEPPKHNMCVTKPVYVERQTRDDDANYGRDKLGEGTKSKYQVTIESRTRVGLNGKQSHIPITSINIAPRNPSPDPDMLDVSIDDILESKLHSRHTKLEDSQVTLIANVKGESEKKGQPKKSEEFVKKEKGEEECSSADELTSLVGGVPTKPMTAHSSRAGLSSAGSVGGELDHLLVAAVSAHSSSPEKNRPPDRAVRTPSAGRPPLIKAALAKTPSQKSTKDAEYIQISQQLHVKPSAGGDAPVDVAMLEGAITPVSSAIQSVCESNKPKTPGPEGDQQLVVHISPEPDVFPDTSSRVNDPVEEENADPEAMNYAFNIPTAGVLESEVNSVIDVGESSQSVNRSISETASND